MALCEMRKTRIVDNSSLHANERAWALMDEEMQQTFIISAESAIDTVLEMEPKYHYRYAMEIERFQETSQISLEDLRKNVPGFVAPQMYIYLDGTELLEYIESNLKMADLQVEHSFERIEACQVCVH